MSGGDLPRRARIGQNPGVDDDVEPVQEPGAGPSDVPWVLDAAVGAAAVLSRFAGGVASTVVRSAPARVLEGVARQVVAPLTHEGESVRARVGDEGVPAAQGLVQRLTPGLVEAVDLDAILAAVDVQGLIDRIDVAGLVGRVDVDRLVSQVDVDAIVSRVDIEALMSRVDIAALLDRVDIEALLGRIDLNELIGQVDLDALLAGVDLDAVLSELDLNAIVDQLDVDALIANTEMGAVIVRSTGGVASEALDAVRSQGVSLDSVVGRIASRLLRRDPDALPTGPPLLVDRPLALPAGEDADGSSEGGAASVEPGSSR